MYKRQVSGKRCMAASRHCQEGKQMERHRESSRNQGVCIEISCKLGSLSKYEESPYYFTFKGRYDK